MLRITSCRRRNGARQSALSEEARALRIPAKHWRIGPSAPANGAGINATSIREMVGQNVQDWLVDREWRGGKDWTITPAFPVPGGGDVGFIRLNVQGRERDGFLSAGDGVENYLDFLCTQLKALKVKETNEPLIGRDCLIARCVSRLLQLFAAGHIPDVAS